MTIGLYDTFANPQQCHIIPSLLLAGRRTDVFENGHIFYANTPRTPLCLQRADELGEKHDGRASENWLFSLS